MQRITVLAPAKLNLTLGITGITENGYHCMDMLMQAVSLYETVELKKSKRITLAMPNSSVPVNPRNTAYRAAELFFQEVGLLAGVDITIRKKIPVCAGMAGGSADAAAVLVGLNDLYGARLTQAELCSMGAQIGADVPFSIVGGTARVTGIGDIITPVPSCPNCFITVCMPKSGISTPKAFARYDEIGSPVQPDNDLAVQALQQGDLHALCAQMQNALQYTSESKENDPICNTLRKYGALSALMTGSGAAVFGVFDTLEGAQNAHRALSKTYVQCFVVRPVNHGTHVVNM